jgi:hypothetical protein
MHARQLYTIEDECVKIPKNCMHAISRRDARGKVIIMDMVVGHDKSNTKHLETQVNFDPFIIYDGQWG